VAGGSSDPSVAPARPMVDRFIVVTGAAGSIGRAVVARLVAEGAVVGAVDLGSSAMGGASLIGSDERVVAAPGVDVTDRVALSAAVEDLSASLGRSPDGLVAAAGVQSFVPIEDLSLEELERTMRINVGGTLVAAQVLMPHLRRTRGAMVLLASVQGRIANVESAHYAASKASVISLGRSLAAALAPDGVRVNCVAPGMIDSDMWDAADRELARLRGLPPGEPRRRRQAQIPLGRAGTPEDVAGVVSFLLSADADYLTGQCVDVSGGDLMR
jgi:NAD(P)-dependent dehydrogenase (short-subunit alcohol dehydrogenase family)